jgi:outer membrane protein
MYKTVTVFLALGLLAAAPLALAANGKLGVVDPEAVLAKSDAGQAAQAQMKAYSKKQRASLEAQQKKLKGERDKLQKNASIQSDAAKKQAQQTFQQHAQAFQKKVQNGQQAVQKKRKELLQPLEAKLHDVIVSYASRHGYEMILDKRAAIYNKKGADLTNAILKAFNAAEASK